MKVRFFMMKVSLEDVEFVSESRVWEMAGILVDEKR